jgi:hypothetical protein
MEYDILLLIYIHDILVMNGLANPLSYQEIRARIETDEEFRKALNNYLRVMQE